MELAEIENTKFQVLNFIRGNFKDFLKSILLTLTKNMVY